jgi:hypothetical protein
MLTPVDHGSSRKCGDIVFALDVWIMMAFNARDLLSLCAVIHNMSEVPFTQSGHFLDSSHWSPLNLN